MFRPQDLEIRAEAEPRSDNGRIWLPGVIAESEFLGHLMRFTVTIGSHQILADDRHHLGRTHFLVGENVAVGLDPSRVRYLSA